MNIRTVDGNLVEDAKVLTNKSGKKYLSFRIANNDFEKGQKVVTYFNVASYNDYAIQKHETENHYSKGKLVVVVGKPEENMTQKGDKMYLNRSILAYNIQLGTFASTKPENNEQTTYRDVAPAAPTVTAPVCEIPRVSQPQVTVPTVEVPSAPQYTADYSASNADTNLNVDDDLPF